MNEQLEELIEDIETGLEFCEEDDFYIISQEEARILKKFLESLREKI